MNWKSILGLVATLALASIADAKIKALIIDGQNNHAVWPKATIMMKQYLEDTGLFEVKVARTAFTWQAKHEARFLPLAGAGETVDLAQPKPDPNFQPAFKDYDVVISNFGNNAASWPEATRQAFERYVREGGGFVVVHAANNSFGDWPAYNQMIGLGGWGGRKQQSGPYVFYANDGKLVRDAETPGGCGKHGPPHNIPLTLRVTDHPITAGLPAQWLTAKDECYALLRGPAENMTILATGKDMSGKAPTDRHEPMLMVLNFGQGRIFHTTLGHSAESMEGVDFITLLTRGAEWAASGKVTQSVPKDFPTAQASSSRAFAVKE